MTYARASARPGLCESIRVATFVSNKIVNLEMLPRADKTAPLPGPHDVHPLVICCEKTLLLESVYHSCVTLF
jgi:hypothetical protein